LKGAERLDGMGLDRILHELRAGDPDGDVQGAWCVKELSGTSMWQATRPKAELLLDKAIDGCRGD
jgi:hypothetical protein